MQEGEARPTASSLYAVLVTCPLPGALSLMPLLIASVDCVKESLTPSDREQKPTFQVFQEVRPRKKKGPPFHTEHCFCRFSPQCFVSKLQELKILRRAWNKP